METLPQLSSLADRKHFLAIAQEKWNNTCTDNSKAREALLEEEKAQEPSLPQTSKGKAKEVDLYTMDTTFEYRVINGTS